MMNKIQLFITKPKTVSRKDKLFLRENNIVVIECEDIESIKLIRQEFDIKGTDMLSCALKAISSQEGFNPTVKNKFMKLLAEIYDAQVLNDK